MYGNCLPRAILSVRPFVLKGEGAMVHGCCTYIHWKKMRCIYKKHRMSLPCSISRWSRECCIFTLVMTLVPVSDGRLETSWRLDKQAWANNSLAVTDPLARAYDASRRVNLLLQIQKLRLGFQGCSWCLDTQLYRNSDDHQVTSRQWLHSWGFHCSENPPSDKTFPTTGYSHIALVIAVSLGQWFRIHSNLWCD